MTQALIEEDNSCSVAVEEFDLERLAAPPAPRARKPILPFAALIVFVLAAGVAALSFWDHWTPPAPASAPPAVPLRLAAIADRSGDAVLVYWNRDASALGQAGRAVLRIEDAGRAEDVELAPEIARLGAVSYRPLGEFVRLQLTLKDPATGQVLDQDSTAISYVEFPQPQPELRVEPVGIEQPGPEPILETVAPPQPAPPAKFVASLPVPPPTAVKLLEAPPVESPAAPSLAGLGAVTPPHRAVRPPEAPAAPRRAASGKVTEPILIRQVQPAYPALARQSRVEGVVHLRIAVDPDGRVSRAEALEGPPPLRFAAVEAVTRWLYRPALLDGDPVGAVLRVGVTFRLSD